MISWKKFHVPVKDKAASAQSISKPTGIRNQMEEISHSCASSQCVEKSRTIEREGNAKRKNGVHTEQVRIPGDKPADPSVITAGSRHQSEKTRLVEIAKTMADRQKQEYQKAIEGEMKALSEAYTAMKRQIDKEVIDLEPLSHRTKS